MEAFNRKMRNCVIFFDISKAFDKVWHNGVLFNMMKHKFDKYIIRWVNEFLYMRNFQIKINSILSDEVQIEVGVPQGGVLSPILFSLYINHIIFDKTTFYKSTTESTLFADDLATSCASRNIKTLEKIFKLYKIYNLNIIENLENWLIKWRLCINPSKCQLILFSKQKQETINIKLFNEIILNF
jgi:retron-type reverse transcriptase